jgi:hypothetical protein
MTDKQATGIMAAIVFENVCGNYNVLTSEEREKVVEQAVDIAERMYLEASYLEASERFTD